MPPPPEGPEERDYVAIGREYAEDVVAGRIVAGKWARLACQRHLDDLRRVDWVYWFDEWEANNVCDFVEKLPHIEGVWETPTIRLEPVQVFILTTVFGWRRAGGYRRFSEVYIEAARKFAKSTLTAAVALYCLCCEDEVGPQIVVGATTGEQAGKVFNPCKRMVEKTPALAEAFELETFARSVTCRQNGGFIQPINAKGKTQDGWNPHLAILDELHAHPDRALFDVIKSAFGARKNPLLWIITTAGFNTQGVCYEQRDAAIKMLGGTVELDHLFAVVFTIDLEPRDDTLALPEALVELGNRCSCGLVSNTLIARLWQEVCASDVIMHGTSWESAQSSREICAWITATAREQFGDCSASNAILQSAFSETLRRVFFAHSPTCGARSLRLSEGGLVVHREADDPFDEAVWPKANPMIGITPTWETMRALAASAKVSAAEEGNFKTKNLNVWMNAVSAWLSGPQWLACADPTLSWDDFKGRDCWIGTDLSDKDDITCAILASFDDDGRLIFKPKFWLPKLVLTAMPDHAEGRGSAKYRTWSSGGEGAAITLTPGDWIDHGEVEKTIRDWIATYSVRRVTFDQFAAGQLMASRLNEDLGTPDNPIAVILPKNAKNVTDPAKDLEARVKSGPTRLRHDNNPVMNWMAGNVCIEPRRDGSILPTKDKKMSANKIDGIDALINAIHPAVTGAQGGQVRSPWEDESYSLTRGPADVAIRQAVPPT